MCGSARPLRCDSVGAPADKCWRGIAGELGNRVTTISGYQRARWNEPLGRLQNPTKACKASRGRRERRRSAAEHDYHEAYWGVEASVDVKDADSVMLSLDSAPCLGCDPCRRVLSAIWDLRLQSV